MRNKWITALGSLLLGLVTLVAVPQQPAAAAPAPWTWVRIVKNIPVEPFGFYFSQVMCPSGYSAITGGLRLPPDSRLYLQAEFRASDGSYWQVDFQNRSSSSGSALVVVECARTADLPSFSYRIEEFTKNASGVWDGNVSCPNVGEVVVTGGVDWSNTADRSVLSNGPVSGAQSWRAVGTNAVSAAVMAVEIYCVDQNQVPGYVHVHQPQGAAGPYTASATCPVGTRVLSGGTAGGTSNSSFPTLNTWTGSSGDFSSTGASVDVRCINAGNPTIELLASPGPDGAISADRYVEFTLGGRDPAGFDNWFHCAVDDAPTESCSSTPLFGPLDNGPHQLAIFNQPEDGRISPILVYHWTVDGDPPTVTAPTLPNVSLTTPRVKWTANDVGTGVSQHQAKLWRAAADGSVTDWTFAPGWNDLPSPTAKLPAMAAGETQCISVRAIDGAGTPSTWSPPRCTARPYDDRSLRASTGWNRGTGTPYWKGTITTTTRAHRTLSRLDAHLNQVGLVATVCPTCGKIDVCVNGTQIRRISLERTTTTHQKVLLLPAFAATTGTVRITSVTTGKSIRIDGLITARTTDTLPPP